MDNCYYEKIGSETKNITDEIPFDIPDTWARLKTTCEIRNGSTPRRDTQKFWNDGSVPWFTIEDKHEQGIFINKTRQHITEIALSKNRVVPRNSVLLCCTASVGEVAFTNIDITTNQQFNGITIKDEYLSMLLPYYILIYSLTLKKTLNQKLATATTYGFVSVSKVESLLLPIPPLKEQENIINKYFELNKKIENIEDDLIDIDILTEKIKYKILDYYFGENSYYKSYYENVSTIGSEIEILDFLRKPINKDERNNRLSKANVKYPYYGANGQAGWIDEFLLDGEYVLVGEDGSPFLNRCANKAYIVYGRMWVNNHAHILKSNKSNRYLMHYLNWFNYDNYVSGTTRLKLNQAKLKSIPFPVLSIDIQTEIADKIDYQFKYIDKIKEQLI